MFDQDDDGITEFSFVETIYELNVAGCVGRQKPTMTGIDDDGWAKVGALVDGL